MAESAHPATSTLKVGQLALVAGFFARWGGHGGSDSTHFLERNQKRGLEDTCSGSRTRDAHRRR